MDRNCDGGEGWMVRGWHALRHALTFVVECEVLALTLNPRTPMANLIRSLRTRRCFRQLVERCPRAAPSQGNRTKARWLWEAPLTAQRASAEAPFPQPNDAVCPVPVHVPRANYSRGVCAAPTNALFLYFSYFIFSCILGSGTYHLHAACFYQSTYKLSISNHAHFSVTFQTLECFTCFFITIIYPNATPAAAPPPSPPLQAPLQPGVQPVAW